MATKNLGYISLTNKANAMKLKIYFNLFICIISFSTFSIACAQMKKKTSKQIQALEKEKNDRTAIQQKIESHLLQAVRTASEEKKSTIANTGDVEIDAKGLANVDIAAEISDSLLQNIKNLGGEIVYPSKEYHTVRAKVPLSSVEIIAAYPSVKFIGPAAVAHNNKISPVNKP